MKNKYVDIVVTYNRIELLKENINVLQNQTFKEHDIMIIDNASTDGTGDFVKGINDDRIKYFNTEKNLGGAGGFSFGLKKAFEMDYEYAWIMDDDSIPQNNALESLIKKAKLINDNFSFLASLVYWTDGNLFNMNIPSIELDRKKNVHAYIEQRNIQLDLLSKYKMMKIRTCSFVGCFINLKKAENVGLPISEFFIYGDDEEYTSRLNKQAPSYLDLDSIIIHKAPSNKGASVSIAPKERISRFYYQIRNTVYMERRDKKILRAIKVIIKSIVKVIIYSNDFKMKRIAVILKGGISGFSFNPQIEFVKKEASRERNENKNEI